MQQKRSLLREQERMLQKLLLPVLVALGLTLMMGFIQGLEQLPLVMEI